MVKPGVLFGVTFAFIISFNNIPLSVFLVRPGDTTLPIAVINYLEYSLDPVMAAVNVASMIFILVVDFPVRKARWFLGPTPWWKQMSVVDIELVSVSKSFGKIRIVKDLNLAIPRGEFVSILGPSGCGKTTTLNMIAGFNRTNSSAIFGSVAGARCGVAPERRNLGLVFQNYALFPHMTVAENVGFGLRMHGDPAGDRSHGVDAGAQSVRLEGFGDRVIPGSCPAVSSSGRLGARDRSASLRSASGRAVVQPRLSSCARPCGSNSRKSSEQLGMTFVYVTHDQEEAMAMSDRIVVMWQGVVAQQGEPGRSIGSPQHVSLPISSASRSNIPMCERRQ